MPIHLRRDAPLIVVCVARGNEVDSKRFAVEITWDGKFDEDEATMAEHLRVRPTKDPAA